MLHPVHEHKLTALEFGDGPRISSSARAKKHKFCRPECLPNARYARFSYFNNTLPYTGVRTAIIVYVYTTTFYIAENTQINKTLAKYNTSRAREGQAHSVSHDTSRRLGWRRLALRRRRALGAGRPSRLYHDSMTKWRITAAMGSRHTGQLKPALCRPRLE